MQIKYVKKKGVTRLAPYILTKVNGFDVEARLDTGADISVMPASTLKNCPPNTPLTVRFASRIEKVWTCIASVEVLGKRFTLPVLSTPVSDFGLLGPDILKYFKLEFVGDVFSLEILEDDQIKELNEKEEEWCKVSSVLKA